MGVFDFLKASKYKEEIDRLTRENQQLQTRLDSLCFSDYDSARKAIEELEKEIKKKKEQVEDYEARRVKVNDQLVKDIQDADEARKAKSEEMNAEIAALEEKAGQAAEKAKQAEEKYKAPSAKLKKKRELYKSVEYAIQTFFDAGSPLNSILLSDEQSALLDELAPSVILKLHYMDVKSLRKAFRDNDKQIETVLAQYRGRYTTKANKTIYDLMVIALRAELQNILYNLKYEKLDSGIDQVKQTTAKYLQLVATGNQSIAVTITKFIGEIEYLFINAVKIEYNYYVKKEQARQEQLAIREQMRQEAEERRALEQEKKKIEREESKYNAEIEKLRQQLEQAAAQETEVLNARILELESKLSDVVLEKDKITSLQNGRAGNVYIISNLGSFGENMFKIGMTRRLDPLDRVNELGSASVPFKFDVHSFIFSEDAVGLENKLHGILNDKRVNKVNLRKEFFYTTVDELEALVNEIEPTAEFNKTMIAEEFRQSQSSDEVYTSDFEESDEDDDE